MSNFLLRALTQTREYLQGTDGTDCERGAPAYMYHDDSTSGITTVETTGFRI